MVLTRALALAFFGLLAGCQIPMDTPEGFLKLEYTGRDVKATSADGAVLWVREFTEQEEGALDFWADAMEHDFVRNRGYELLDRTPIKDAAGREGVVQRYDVVTDGEPHGYLVALFVVDDGIRVAQYTAPKSVYDLRLPAVQAALETLR